MSVTIANLTPRETQIVGLLVEHYTNQQIGEKLGISVNTVAAHRARLQLKLGAKNMRDVYLAWQAHTADQTLL